MNLPTPIIDTREQKIYAFSDDFFKEPIHKKLETGDYSLLGFEDTIAIERKRSVTEIATNAFEARFKRCIERLSQIKHAYIICEFEYGDLVNFPHSAKIPNFVKKRIGRISGAFLCSYMLDITVKYRIPVIYAGNQNRGEFITGSILKKLYAQRNNTDI